MKTAECVSPKHPDKMADQISDAILDLCLAQDPFSRVAVEVLGGHGEMLICGEVTTKAAIVKDEIRAIVVRIVGYEPHININIVEQSPEIAGGVDTGGAGDQGIMVGYACRENPAMIPHELYLARNLCECLFEIFPFDGKTQITLDDNGLVHTIVASFQNAPKDKLEELINVWVSVHEEEVRKGLKIHANPAGDWMQGGFDADTGLTGRKLAVDNYGVQFPIGGGAFSGKDATKVDRSAAYMARKIAVDLLKVNRDAQDCVVKIAYAIGVAQPVMATATLKYDGLEDKEIDLLAEWQYNLTPKAIIEALDLRKPQFEETARWGHFGRGFTWDK